MVSALDLHSRDTSLEALRVQMAVLRRIGPEARLAQALELSEMMRRERESGVRLRRPEASDEEVRLEAIELALGAGLFREAFSGSGR